MAADVSAFNCYSCSSVLNQLRSPQTKNNVLRESIHHIKNVNDGLRGAQSPRFLHKGH